MKSETEIKTKIKELRDEGTIVSFIGMIMLLWVLGTDVTTIYGYVDNLQVALKSVSDFVDQL